MSIGGRIKRVHQLDVLERLDKKNPKLAQEPVLNRRRHAVDNSSVEKWTQDKTTVTNGDITLEVGSRITGYEACGISDWYVLGAEEGRLLITTKSCPERVRLSGREGYTNGVKKLDEASEKYINYIYADGARSITVDDINRVTGYNPENAGYGKNKLWQYGNEVTYYWDGISYPYYSGSNGVTGNLDWRHDSGFYYPTVEGVKCSRKSTIATESNKEEITTLTSTYYWYKLSDCLIESSDAYQQLFRGKSYWLGSQCVGCGPDFAVWGLRCVYGDGYVYHGGLANSYGYESYYYFGVLPVVSLKSEVKVDSNGNIAI